MQSQLCPCQNVPAQVARGQLRGAQLDKVAFLRAIWARGGGPWSSSHLRPDQGLEAGLEVIDAAAVKFGHLLQELLVFGLKVLLHRPQLLAGLKNETGGESKSWGKP